MEENVLIEKNEIKPIFRWNGELIMRNCKYHKPFFTLTSEKPCKVFGQGVCKLDQNIVCPRMTYTYSNTTQIK